jgi:hypothetical protein
MREPVSAPLIPTVGSNPTPSAAHSLPAMVYLTQNVRRKTKSTYVRSLELPTFCRPVREIYNLGRWTAPPQHSFGARLGRSP